MTASVGREMAMYASRFRSLVSMIPRLVSAKTVLELLLPQKCFLGVLCDVDRIHGQIFHIVHHVAIPSRVSVRH